MAPGPTAETSSAPLADWFFISGVDSDQLTWGREEDLAANNVSPPSEPTIEEDRLAEAEHVSPDFPPTTPRNRKRNSYQRLSRLSDDARLSIASISSTPDRKGTDSNRSSATIKGIQIVGKGVLNDQDFDRALRKFASERDSFLSDLTLSAGAIVPNRPKPRPKTQRIVNEDASALKSGLGSIRRRVSFRDMNSLKRQSTVARQASVRTSRRMSNYNSVIPNPQPLHAEASTHPLKRRLEPVLLDRYPPKSMVEETKRRGTFPDYVPMFAFPNDVNIVSSDERPRSTWHGFSMTSSDNSRLHGICIIMWMPLNQRASEELERRCEEWRRDNMTDEERELASSLGERLALERVKLSRLLARLPSVASESTAREILEDDISAVEEKIGLMTDLLRPVRHGAAAKIDGLTNGETGLWIPRSYGILGRDASLTTFWKEWLRAVVVPMTDGGILRVPPSSPKIGMWQPLERYVVNLCTEALSPITSKTQVEVAVRELRLFARKEAVNELPGSRNTDLYALFRALSIPNIVVLLEFALAESRIILLSSHTSMLHLASKALVELLYPMTWAGVFIPVLPARLIQALEAPCPYIVGIERRYEKIELPEDDFVLVDLDQDEIESTTRPTPMPRQQRRKLNSLLQVAAPHHNRFGVPAGPPAYAMESFPFDTFSSENSSLFNGHPPLTTLAKYVSLNSTSFGDAASSTSSELPLFNAFSAQNTQRIAERPSTSRSGKATSPDSPKLSPTSIAFPPVPSTPISSIHRKDSGFDIQSTLREKRSGHFDALSKRSSTYGVDRYPTRPSAGLKATVYNGMHSMIGQTARFAKTKPRVGSTSVPGAVYVLMGDALNKSVWFALQHFILSKYERLSCAFNEFIHERETKPATDPSIVLFDQVILSKKNRGRTSMFSKSKTDFLSDTSDHLWRSAAANPPKGRFPGDYRAIITRIPAKLDPTLMKEPRVIQGVPRINTTKAQRKPIPSMLGPNKRMNGMAQSPS
ncbi:DENN domain-containing protein [Physcia stellaris]|nr:DENN domain-containing protein [Physcia stellaris]